MAVTEGARASRPAEGLTIVLAGVAGDHLGSWRYDRRRKWWVSDEGQALTLDQVQAEVLALIGRTPEHDR